MQKISMFIGCMLIALNVIAYLCFTAYPLFNCIATSIIIVIEMILQCAISRVRLKDGFKFSLASLMPIGAIVCIILGVTAHDRIENNINLYIAIVLIIIQISLILISKKVSKNLK